MLDALRAVIFILDRWGNVVHANRRACLWRPLEQTRGKSFFEISQHWDHPGEAQREIMTVARTGIPVWGARERAVENGREFWFSVDKIPLQDKQEQVSGVMLVVNDVTGHIHREVALEQSEARYKAFISTSHDAIWRFDISPPVDTKLPPDAQTEQILRRAVLAECNITLAQMFGADHPGDVLGLPLDRSGALSNRHDIRAFIEYGYSLTEQEFTRVDHAGTRRHMQSSAIGIVENGYLTRAWGVTRDVTAQRSYLDHMEYLANHDSLTRLPNRALLYSTVEQALADHGHQRLMALLLIDLDRFKEINDTLGHRAGDNVLQQLGPRLEAELAEIDGLIARLGGDEFAVFLPRLRNEQQAVVLGHRLMDCLCEPFEIESIRTEVSASVGISFYPNQAQDLSALMRYADVAMYHAKTTMKGVSVYDPDCDPHSPTRLELMGALRSAIRDSQLLLYFQPKVNLQSHTVYGFEALVRWQHSEFGMVPPNDFVPIAERSNLIFPLTCWVLENTIRQCASWRKQGMDISIAMNLSPRNVTDDRLLSELKRLLQKYELEGRYLELEITESVILTEPVRALKSMQRIAELGVRFSIDDYGTGYSSLAYLKRLPVQELKIDKSFIQNILEDEQDEIIVSSTIQMAHSLGLKVVAEGVETPEIYRRLEHHRCDSVQGYHVARPMAEQDIEQWLEQGAWSVACSTPADC